MSVPTKQDEAEEYSSMVEGAKYRRENPPSKLICWAFTAIIVLLVGLLLYGQFSDAKIEGGIIVSLSALVLIFQFAGVFYDKYINQQQKIDNLTLELENLKNEESS